MKTTQLTAILLLFSLSLSLYGQKRPEALSEMSPSFSYSEPEGFSTAIATDKNGRTWIGKADALACYNGSYYLVYKDVGEGSTMINSHVHDLAFDSSGILWIADNRGCQYFSDGVFYDIVDPSLGACMRIMEISDNVMVTTGLLGLVTVGKDGIRNSFYRKGLSFTEYLAVSPHKEVWTATHSTATSTIYVLGQDLEEVAEIPLGSNVLINDFTILEDGSLWVLTNNGLRIFDTATKKEISPDISLKRTVGRDALFVRNWKPGMVLLGVHEKGLSILDTRSLQQQPVFTEEKLSGSSYTCHVTPSEVIWLSEGQSSSVHYSTKGIIPNLLSSLHPEYQFSSTKLRSDSKGQIWIMRGRLLEGFDPATNQILDEIWEDSEFTDIFIDHNDHLWAAFGRTDVREYDISEGRLTLVNRHSYPEETIVSISGDRNGNIWIFLDTCVRMISAKEPQTTVTSRPQHRGSTLTERPGGRLFMIGNDGVNYLCEDSLINIRSLPIPDVISNPRTMLHASDGTTWVGTQNDGVYRFDNNSAIIDHFHTYNGLPDNQIRNVVEGPGGEIWISTRSHITKYSPSSASLHSIRGAGFSSLFPYGRESGVIGNDGRLYFAGDGGVSAIEVDMEIPDNMSKAPEIDFVSINGTPVIPVPKALKLSSKQNNIQICFACPDDTGVSKSGYSIILQGLDRTWRYTNNNEAYFHSLRPGRYEFKVKSLNGGDNSTSLSFKIAYPPLSSIPARILYLVMFLALSFFFYDRRRRTKAIKESEKLKQEKLDFMTNIAHEFKTPLTMIYGPVKQLSEKDDLMKEDRELLTLAMNAASRLSSLSDQILNITDLNESVEVLKVSETDIVALTSYITDAYRYAFHEKDIELLTSLPEKLTGWVDEDKIFKILSNLLSNAVKYTPEHGKVDVSLDSEGERTLISVTDNGPGIPEGMRGRIFERFDRLGAEKSHIEGSGVGLNYAKFLATLHKGTLEYSPAKDTGACFTLSIPILEKEYDESEKTERKSSIELLSKDQDASEEQDSSKKTVLVVEDDLEIRLYLRYLMNEKYNVLLAADGEAAMHLIRNTVPDLVVSDYIMPEMDGLELCSKIKNDPDLRHIAFLMLTAKKDRNSKLEGLESGVDAYIPKPFDPDIFLAEVGSILLNREKMQQTYYSLSTKNLKADDIPASLNERDRAFLTGLQECVEANIGNELLSIEEIADTLCVSYSSLYVSTKTLTGLTPQAYLTKKRMEKAKELIMEGNLSITDIAEAVGFASLSNFSRVFKKTFGTQPSSFKSEQMK